MDPFAEEFSVKRSTAVIMEVKTQFQVKELKIGKINTEPPVE